MTSGRDLAVKPGARTVAAQRAAPGPTLDPLVAALRQRRQQLGLTQVELAARLNVSANGFSHWECGRRTPSLYLLRRWCVALDVTLTAVVPPDVDEIAVHRALAGDRVKLNDAEIDTVIAVLTRRGHSAQEIAATVGLTQRSVVRRRARLREVA